MVHSRDYEVQDTLAVSELLHVPKYYMHAGLCLCLDTFLNSGSTWGKWALWGWVYSQGTLVDCWVCYKMSGSMRKCDNVRLLQLASRVSCSDLLRGGGRFVGGSAGVDLVV